MTGFLFLAVVLDAWSRKIVGWSMANHLRPELVIALEMAIGQRRPGTVIHHSDQGCQYTSLAFGKRCNEAGVRPSLGCVGDAYDNAMVQSFFATLECDLLERSRFASQAEARMACSASSRAGTILFGSIHPLAIDRQPPTNPPRRPPTQNRSHAITPRNRGSLSLSSPQPTRSRLRPAPCTRLASAFEALAPGESSSVLNVIHVSMRAFASRPSA